MGQQLSEAPYHAHVYFQEGERVAARRLQELLAGMPDHVLFVGKMTWEAVGPHPIPQFEVHFVESSLPIVVSVIEASHLRALVHPLTDDDLADHTTLGEWLGEPVPLDLSVLDPPGQNKGMARFGKTDF